MLKQRIPPPRPGSVEYDVQKALESLGAPLGRGGSTYAARGDDRIRNASEGLATFRELALSGTPEGEIKASGESDRGFASLSSGIANQLNEARFVPRRDEPLPDRLPPITRTIVGGALPDIRAIPGLSELAAKRGVHVASPPSQGAANTTRPPFGVTRFVEPIAATRPTGFARPGSPTGVRSAASSPMGATAPGANEAEAPGASRETRLQQVRLQQGDRLGPPMDSGAGTASTLQASRRLREAAPEMAEFLEAGPRRASGDHFSQRRADEIVEYTRAQRSVMNQTADVLQIPATAIAASIGEEYRTRNLLKDSIPDSWGRFLLGDGGEHEFGPYITANDWLEYLYEDLRPTIEAHGHIQGRVSSRVGNPLKLDIGVGNVNFGTAMHLVKQYLADPAYQDDPLDLRGYDGHYDQLFRDMLNPRSDALVRIVGLKLADVQDFYMNGPGAENKTARRLRSAYVNSSGAERDELLNAGYRASYREIVRRAQLSDSTIGSIPRENYYDYFADPRSPYHASVRLILNARDE